MPCVFLFHPCVRAAGPHAGWAGTRAGSLLSWRLAVGMTGAWRLGVRGAEVGELGQQVAVRLKAAGGTLPLVSQAKRML